MLSSLFIAFFIMGLPHLFKYWMSGKLRYIYDQLVYLKNNIRYEDKKYILNYGLLLLLT